MRILVICYEYPPIGGGGAPACQGVCEAQVRLGHEVDVVTSGMSDLPEMEWRHGVAIHRVRCWRRHRHYSNTGELLTGLRPAYRKAMQLVRENRYDLIHCHFAVPSGLVARAVARKTGLPYILTAHGSDIPGYNPDRFNFVHKMITPTWQSIVSEATIVNTPSEYLRDLLQAQLDVPVDIIPYGFNPPADPGVERKDRVLVVTRMFERKGVQHVIDAMSQIKTGWQLCIAGDGPYLPTLKEQAAKLDLDVDFRGYVRGQDLVDLYHSAKVFALPSSSDNFPVVLLEAMGAGCATVTTSGTGCAEVVGDAGVTIEHGDPSQLRNALESLVNDPARVKSLREAALERVQRYHWDRVGKEYEALYYRAAAAGRTTAAVEPSVRRPSPMELPPLTTTPRVSVLMANFNYRPYISRAIKSVLNQSYDNWELLICDDGSTDGSVPAMKIAAGDDPRIRIIEKENGGQASTWNAMWPHATGEIIAFLDSDDVFVADKLQTVVDEFRKRPDSGLMVHRLQVVSEDDEPIQVIPFLTRLEDGWIADGLVRRGGRWRYMPSSALCVRREVAEPFFPLDLNRFGPWPDSALFYPGPLLTHVISHDRPLAQYRMHDRNQSSSSTYTPRAVWHDIHSVHKAIKGTNLRLEELGYGQPLDVRRHLQLRTQAYTLARLWGRRGGVRGYVGLMRGIFGDDLFSLKQKSLACVVYGMLLVLPRSARSAWLGETLGVSRIKQRIKGLKPTLGRRPAPQPSAEGQVALSPR